MPRLAEDAGGERAAVDRDEDARRGLCGVGETGERVLLRGHLRRDAAKIDARAQRAGVELTFERRYRPSHWGKALDQASKWKMRRHYRSDVSGGCQYWN